METPSEPDDLNAKSCPNALTSNHSAQAAAANLSVSFPLALIRGSARSLRLFIPSSARSADWTKIFCPSSCRRLRSLRFTQTSEISPRPLIVVLGRLPLSGSPLGFAPSTYTATAKSTLFLMLSITHSSSVSTLSSFFLNWSSRWQ